MAQYLIPAVAAGGLALAFGSTIQGRMGHVRGTHEGVSNLDALNIAKEHTIAQDNVTIPSKLFFRPGHPKHGQQMNEEVPEESKRKVDMSNPDVVNKDPECSYGSDELVLTRTVANDPAKRYRMSELSQTPNSGL